MKPKTLLKLIPPVEYNGAADAHAYHQFITEGTDYVTSGKVSKNWHAFVLSYYLKGKAYDFIPRVCPSILMSGPSRNFLFNCSTIAFPWITGPNFGKNLENVSRTIKMFRNMLLNLKNSST